MDITLINPLEHNVEQRTEEWKLLKLGLISSSIVDTLMPARNKAIDSFNQAQLSILSELAVQRITGIIEDSFESKHMKTGTLREPEAFFEYELRTGKVVDSVGFVTYLDYGDSPDGLIREERAIEIKSPKSTTHFEYIKNPKLLRDKYKWQGYNHMIANQVSECDFISYHPKFKGDKN